MNKPEVTYRINVSEETIPVRGNAMASGDEALDKQYEDEILARLERGEVWAWADVTVIAECEGFQGHAFLGGCSYKDEADFKRDGGYYEDLKTQAFADLLTEMSKVVARGERAAEIVKALTTP